MATQKTNKPLDINTAFNFVFQDPEWLKKTAIAGILLVTIIGGLAVYGWALEIQRRVIQNKKAVLPNWDNIGEYFVRGLKFFVVSFIWTLPLQVYNCITVFYTFSYTMSSEYDPRLPPPSLFPPEIQLLVSCLVIIVSLALTLLTPLYSGMLAETDSVRKALNFRRGFQLLGANLKQLIGVLLLSYLAGVIGSLGFLFLCIGIVFTLPISFAIIYHLFGQAYRNALAKAK